MMTPTPLQVAKARRLAEEAWPDNYQPHFNESFGRERDAYAKAWERALPIVERLARHVMHEDNCNANGIRDAHGNYLCSCGLSEAMEEYNKLNNP